MDQETAGRSGESAADARPDVETASQLNVAEIERDWAARRLEISRGLDAAVQQAIANVLNTAAETRTAIEQEAKAVLDRLRHERSRLVDDIREYRRQREGLASEVADTRRRAEEEASRLRRAAEAERAQMLKDGESRKAELTIEIQRLEQQLADVSSGIQSLLQEQIGRFSRGEPTQSSRRSPPPAAPQPERPARNPEASSSRRGSGSASGAIASATEGPTPPATVEALAPPAAPRAEPIAPTPAARAPATSQPARATTPRAEVEAPVATAPRPEASTETPPPQVPAPAASAAVAASAYAASAQPGTAPSAAAPAAASAGRIEVAVTNTPSFAKALELQRAIQRTEGVRQVQALQFERGTLVLSVEHDLGIDIATVASETLSGLGVELVERGAERLELSFSEG